MGDDDDISTGDDDVWRTPRGGESLVMGFGRWSDGLGALAAEMSGYR